jgi:hypothetical protein
MNNMTPTAPVGESLLKSVTIEYIHALSILCVGCRLHRVTAEADLV